jgi:hypothetical protein
VDKCGFPRNITKTILILTDMKKVELKVAKKSNSLIMVSDCAPDKWSKQ